MIETLTVSLILTFISGITFIAYRHPDGFHRIYIGLVFVSSLILAIVIAYNSGVKSCQDVVYNSLSNPTRDSLNVLLSQKNIASDIVIPVWFLFLIYINILLWLPDILKKKEK